VILTFRCSRRIKCESQMRSHLRFQYLKGSSYAGYRFCFNFLAFDIFLRMCVKGKIWKHRCCSTLFDCCAEFLLLLCSKLQMRSSFLNLNEVRTEVGQRPLYIDYSDRFHDDDMRFTSTTSTTTTQAIKMLEIATFYHNTQPKSYWIIRELYMLSTSRNNAERTDNRSL